MAKKSKHSEAGTGAILALQKAGITPVIHTYEHDERAQAWGLEAAQALGLDPARVFNTKRPWRWWLFRWPAAWI